MLTVDELCAIRTLSKVLLKGIAALRDGSDGRLVNNRSWSLVCHDGYVFSLMDLVSGWSVLGSFI